MHPGVVREEPLEPRLRIGPRWAHREVSAAAVGPHPRGWAPAASLRVDVLGNATQPWGMHMFERRRAAVGLIRSSREVPAKAEIRRSLPFSMAMGVATGIAMIVGGEFLDSTPTGYVAGVAVGLVVFAALAHVVMEDWLVRQAEQRRQEPPHRYGLEDFGLTAGRVAAAFAPYREFVATLTIAVVPWCIDWRDARRSPRGVTEPRPVPVLCAAPPGPTASGGGRRGPPSRLCKCRRRLQEPDDDAILMSSNQPDRTGKADT